MAGVRAVNIAFKGASISGKRVIAALLLALFCGTLFAKEQNVSALRSAYLYYFSNLIEWPAGTNFNDGYLHLCAATQSIDDRFQLGTIDGKKIKQLTLSVTYIDSHTISSARVSHCHIVFLGAGVVESLESLPPISASTLLITEGDTVSSGLIHLFIQDKRLKFKVDTQQLANKSFKVSSKLLRLSRSESL